MSVNDPVGVIGLTQTPGKFIAGAKRGVGFIDLREAKDGDKVDIEYHKVVHISDEQEKK